MQPRRQPRRLSPTPKPHDARCPAALSRVQPRNSRYQVAAQRPKKVKQAPTVSPLVPLLESVEVLVLLPLAAARRRCLRCGLRHAATDCAHAGRLTRALPSLRGRGGVRGGRGRGGAFAERLLRRPWPQGGDAVAGFGLAGYCKHRRESVILARRSRRPHTRGRS